ncbi:MAG TPA: GGDEF domain-containing protein [Planococcus sp. (in: firmicutes)]|nr:GGDEF domain-containing protein [Planococcus sp. (in: firmicutes)]
MDKQLNSAPCGYVVIEENFSVAEMNQTLRDMLGLKQTPVHMHDLLTVASRVYFQTYFTPSVKTHGKVEEMYLTLKGLHEKIPVLMNAVARDGKYECVLIQMKVRGEYENELLLAKRSAERINRDSEDANSRLQMLLQEVEDKQRQLVKLNNELEEYAMTDPLTSLKNRRYLEKRFHQMMDSGREHMACFSIALIDIDHFKRVNDTYGHQVGDAVLQELAWRLQCEAGEDDIVARLGGEEFIVVLNKLDKQEAEAASERIRGNMERADWSHAAITVSIGVATYSFGDSHDSLYQRADKALYQSKERGRNRVTAG